MQVFIGCITYRSSPLRLVRCLCPWSRSNNSNPKLCSNVVFSVLLSEEVIGREEDCSFFDLQPIWRGKFSLVFFWLRLQGVANVIELSPGAFDDDSVSSGSRSTSSSFFFSTLCLIFYWLYSSWVQRSLVLALGVCVPFPLQRPYTHLNEINDQSFSSVCFPGFLCLSYPLEQSPTSIRTHISFPYLRLECQAQRPWLMIL